MHGAYEFGVTNFGFTGHQVRTFRALFPEKKAHEKVRKKIDIHLVISESESFLVSCPIPDQEDALFASEKSSQIASRTLAGGCPFYIEKER